MAKRKNTENKIEPLKTGRPTKYSPELAAIICEKIATSTVGLRRICSENEDLPSSETILQWRHKYPDFSAQYARAKQHQADLLAEDILDIADDDSGDQIITEQGIKMDSEFVARSRLKIDSRKWLASKLLPKIYGDKIQNETNITFNHEKALAELQ